MGQELALHLEKDKGSVIPGEQRETRNPGGILEGLYSIFLDSRFRGNDASSPSLKIIEMEYQSSVLSP